MTQPPKSKPKSDITNAATSSEIVRDDPWPQLKQFTQARIALGRVGSSLPTREVLDFSLSHALARDAVHLALDTQALIEEIQNALAMPVLHVHSQAQDRATYLLRPDRGRQLSQASRDQLAAARETQPVDLLLVVADGLSSLAIRNHALPLLLEIRKQAPADWHLGQIVLASQARVALADEVGALLGANMVAMLIGERPGLSSPDSLGIYLTYQPKPGCSDADRNCISNVRPDGLHYAAAAKKLLWLAKEAKRLRVSGVALKDESDVVQINATETTRLG